MTINIMTYLVQCDLHDMRADTHLHAHGAPLVVLGVIDQAQIVDVAVIVVLGQQWVALERECSTVHLRGRHINKS